MNDQSATQVHSEKELAEKVLANPKFQAMARQKSIVGWTFSAIMFFVYVAFIVIIGADPALFAQKVSESGVTTVGIYVGVFVIVFSFLITLVYVSLANGRYENLTQEVIQEVMGEKK
ncbi:DUF485 domain-containing protein [Neisseriaceae bacterium B1]